MPGWFAQVSAFTIFLTIAAIGFLFLLFSLLFGDLGHDLHFDHGLEHGGVSFFSTRIISVFITAFGGFGAVATHYGLSTFAASGVGLVSGAFFASLIYAFARFLYGQQASSDIRAGDLLGQTARVVVAIPAGGVGQVRCHVGEQLVDKIARSDDGQAVSEHATVRVENILGETVVVRRL